LIFLYLFSYFYHIKYFTMKNYSIYSILLFILLYGCKTNYIAPSLQVPLLKEAGELQLYSGTGADGLFLNGTYAVSQHMGIMTGINLYKYSPYDEMDLFEYTENIVGTLGGGYFNRIGNGESWLNYYDVYAGARMGQGPAIFPYKLYADTIMTAPVLQFFIQPSIGHRDDETDMAFTLRYVNHVLNYTTPENYVEPLFTFKFGYKQLKLISQLGMSFYLGTRYSDRYSGFQYSLLHFNFGLQWDIFTRRHHQ